ncbi:MAG: iron-containing alcohol dehydrogenase [Alphaproteobacteria bacterium]|nr:iron-containing alcohol dehydrogenase [Alphaproteobacteria bacterium]
MFERSIQDILAARLQPLPALVMAGSLRKDIDELVALHHPAGSLAVIDDVDTGTAYGDLVFRALKGRYEATHITLRRGVRADEEALAEIETKSKRADLLVAVGSGTINDLVKFAAHRATKPYIIFPTAASMNGYVSANASILMGGHKQSHEASLPLAVLVDAQMLVAAPARLSQAGLGDSLARPTAQADWLLSHHLTGEAYDDAPYQLTQPYEAQVFGQAEGVRRGDAEAIEALFTLLLLSGFGMTIAGSSRPASGAEHMIAHMLSDGSRLHGEEIAVTAVEMAARQAKCMTQKNIFILPAEDGSRREQPTIAAWEKAKEAMQAIHIPPQELELIRKKAGLPESYEALGWSAEEVAGALAGARFTRDRFTCLDVE